MAYEARVRMLRDARGAPDRLQVFDYKAGQHYSEETEPRMSEELAAVFIQYGDAEPWDGASQAEGEVQPLDPQTSPASKRKTKPAGPPETK